MKQHANLLIERIVPETAPSPKPRVFRISLRHGDETSAQAISCGGEIITMRRGVPIQDAQWDDDAPSEDSTFAKLARALGPVLEGHW